MLDSKNNHYNHRQTRDLQWLTDSSRANLARLGKAKARIRERSEGIRPVGIGPGMVEHSEVEGVRFEKVK